MTDYKHVGSHAEDLADGRMFGPGETFELDDEAIKDPHNARLLDEGIIISLDEQDGPDATEEAIKLAKSSKIGLNAVTGTGQGGRITKEDVQREIDAASENDNDEGR